MPVSTDLFNVTPLWRWPCIIIQSPIAFSSHFIWGCIWPESHLEQHYFSYFLLKGRNSLVDKEEKAQGNSCLEVRIYHTGSILYLVIVVCRLLSTDLQTTLANLLMTLYERNSTQSNRAVKFVKMGGQASKSGTSWKSLTRIACIVSATRRTQIKEQCLTEHCIFRRQTHFSFWCYC